MHTRGAAAVSRPPAGEQAAEGERVVGVDPLQTCSNRQAQAGSDEGRATM